MRLSGIFKTKIVTNLTKVILESSYRVLQAKFKWKTLKQLLYFLKAIEFCPTFDIQIDWTLDIFWEAHRSLSKHFNIYINRATNYEITAL